MTQLEKIKEMGAEELAQWLTEDIEQSQAFSNSFCDSNYCLRMREIEVAEERGEYIELGPCSDESCLAAAVLYLNSEVKE